MQQMTSADEHRTDSTGSATRRRFLAAGGALAATSIAGCADLVGQAEESEDDEGSYSVEMEPAGEVRFDSVPEVWFPYTGDYADMGVALGQADGLEAVGIKDRFGTGYYEELPGVSVDKGRLTQLWQDGTSREVFLDIDADVHLIDPNFMINRISWSQDDIDEIENSVAPFAGNTIFSGSYPWHEDYTYYSLLEAFEKVAAIFQEQERYEAFESLHETVTADVSSRLPSESGSVAVLYPRGNAGNGAPDAFLPYTIDSGTSFKQWRELGVDDALAASDVADFHQTRGNVDYETLLEVDPEYIAMRYQGRLTESEFQEQYVAPLEGHDVASELTAVQEGNVIRSGMPYQGPIIYLFQLEMTTQDLYPEEFGDEELFDRQRVADIINGAF